MRNAVQRAAFVLLSCALLLGAVKWVPEQEAPPVAALPDVYVSGGYAVSTEAAYDQRSLDYAARKLQQLPPLHRKRRTRCWRSWTSCGMWISRRG